MQSATALVGLAALVVLEAWCPGTAAAQPTADEVAERDETPPRLRLTPRTGEAIRNKLQKTVDVNFVDTPLSDVVAFLADAADVPFLIDRAALAGFAVPIDEPIDHLEADATVETILDRVLVPLGLTWTIENEVVEITTHAKTEDLEQLVQVVYDARPLLERLGSIRTPGRFDRLRESNREYPVGITRDYYFVPGMGGCLGVGWPVVSDTRIAPEDSVLDAVIRTIGAPESWEDQGGPGSVTLVDGLLVVRHRPAAHERIESLLRELLRLSKAEPSLSETPIHRRFYPTEADAKVAAKLGQAVSVDFAETPLKEALDFVADAVGVKLLVDEIAFEEEGLPLDVPVTLSLQNVTARAALHHVLAPHDLTTLVDRGAVVVTSEIVAEDLVNLSTVIHDARRVVRDGDVNEVVDAIVRLTGPPESWEDQGGPGSIAAFENGLLVVRQTQAVQHEIASLLRDLASAPEQAEDEATAKPEPRPLLDYKLPKHEPQAIVDLITGEIDPPHWKPNADDGGTIRVVGQQIFVRTTPENHVRIHDLLRRLSLPPTTGEPDADSQPEEGKDTASSD